MGLLYNWNAPPRDPFLSAGTQDFLTWVQTTLNSLIGNVNLLTAPFGVATVGVQNGVEISWGEVPTAISYNIYESPNQNKPSQPTGNVPTTGRANNSWLRAGLNDTTTRFYAVAAVDARGREGTLSNWVAGAASAIALNNSNNPPNNGGTTPTDLPYNSGFEIFPDGTTIADGWAEATGNVSGGRTYSRNSTAPILGTYSQNITQSANTDAGGLRSRAFGVKPGLQYDVHIFVKANAPNVGSLYVGLAFFDQNIDFTIGGPDYLTSTYIVAANKNVGTGGLFSGQVTAPANARFACLVIYNFSNATAPGTLTYDGANVTIAQVSQPLGSNGITAAPTASTIFATLPEMSVTITTHGSNVQVIFSGNGVVGSGSGEGVLYKLLRDGSQIGNTLTTTTDPNSNAPPAMFNFIDNPAAGSHTYSVQWAVSGGSSATMLGTQRSIQAVEMN